MPVFTGGGLQSGLDPALQAYADPLTTFRPGAGSAFGPGLGTAPAPGGIRTPQAAAGQNATVKQAQATANLTSAQAGAVQQKLDLQRELFRALFGPSGQGGGFLGELLGLGNRAVDKVGGGANLGGDRKSVV